MLLREIAHARTGDKGDIVTISLIAWRPEDFPVMEQRITAERVQAHFAAMIDGTVLRYAIPHLSALNFVLRRPQGQAVTRTLALDAHGKCLGSALLAMELENESAPA
ncbi:MAG TPA: hypothetical protein VMB19_05720 [Silvibacterium sp.]|nr:hypothetical protein [Silvibacterium sp.]